MTATRITLHCALLLLLLLAAAPPAAAQPRIDRVTLEADGVALDGRGFGTRCGKCEVFALHDDGLRYAVPVRDWTDARIAVRVPDLNRGPAVRLLVRAAAAESNATPLTLVRRTDVRVVFSHASEAKVGDAGERQLDVGTAAPGCGARAQVFDRAELRYTRRRFGEAQIVAAPPSGCTNCTPLAVRWYHEPTGYLDFRVEAHRRWVDGVCADRVR